MKSWIAESAFEIIIKEYLRLGGIRTEKEINDLSIKFSSGRLWFFKLPEHIVITGHILSKLHYARKEAIKNGGSIKIIITDTQETLSGFWREYRKQKLELAWEDKEVKQVERCIKKILDRQDRHIKSKREFARNKLKNGEVEFDWQKMRYREVKNNKQ